MAKWGLRIPTSECATRNVSDWFSFFSKLLFIIQLWKYKYIFLSTKWFTKDFVIFLHLQITASLFLFLYWHDLIWLTHKDKYTKSAHSSIASLSHCGHATLSHSAHTASSSTTATTLSHRTHSTMSHGAHSSISHWAHATLSHSTPNSRSRTATTSAYTSSSSTATTLRWRSWNYSTTTTTTSSSWSSSTSPATSTRTWWSTWRLIGPSWPVIQDETANDWALPTWNWYVQRKKLVKPLGIIDLKCSNHLPQYGGRGVQIGGRGVHVGGGR